MKTLWIKREKTDPMAALNAQDRELVRWLKSPGKGQRRAVGGKAAHRPTPTARQRELLKLELELLELETRR